MLQENILSNHFRAKIILIKVFWLYSPCNEVTCPHNLYYAWRATLKKPPVKQGFNPHDLLY